MRPGYENRVCSTLVQQEPSGLVLDENQLDLGGEEQRVIKVGLMRAWVDGRMDGWVCGCVDEKMG